MLLCAGQPWEAMLPSQHQVWLLCLIMRSTSLGVVCSYGYLLGRWPAFPPLVTGLGNALHCAEDRLDWESLGIVGRHLELLMEPAAAVFCLGAQPSQAPGSPQSEANGGSQQPIRFHRGRCQFRDRYRSLYSRTGRQGCTGQRALRIHRNLLEESVAEYAMAASSSEDD